MAPLGLQTTDDRLLERYTPITKHGTPSLDLLISSDGIPAAALLVLYGDSSAWRTLRTLPTEEAGGGTPTRG